MQVYFKDGFKPIKSVEAIYEDQDLDLSDKHYLLAALLLDDREKLVSPLAALLKLLGSRFASFNENNITLDEKTRLVALNRAAQAARDAVSFEDIGRLIFDLFDYMIGAPKLSKNRYNASIYVYYETEIKDFDDLLAHERILSAKRKAARAKRSYYCFTLDKRLRHDYRFKQLQENSFKDAIYTGGLSLQGYRDLCANHWIILNQLWRGDVGSAYYCKKILLADLLINNNFDRFIEQLKKYQTLNDTSEYGRGDVTLEGYLRSVSFCHKGLEKRN